MVVEKVGEKKRKGNRQIHVEEENCTDLHSSDSNGKKKLFYDLTFYLVVINFLLLLCVINYNTVINVTLKPIPFSMN